jgi:ATP-dependent RNA helicase RhlE
MKFAELGLIEPLLRAVASEKYVIATPVQAQSIPPLLEGRDLLGCAQTGTGKTAAFALPMLQRLSTTAPPAGRPRVRALVLCPTRELGVQIASDFRNYGKNLKLRVAVIFGGVNQNPQVQMLRQGIDVLVSTPGRLLDLMGQGHADLRGVEMLVLDEADRMLDMGFILDIRKIISRVPEKRQTMLFSATMPPEIKRLADSLLKDPVSVQITPVATTAANISESVYFVERTNKPQLLAHLFKQLPMSRAIVFVRTKHGADRVVRQLYTFGIRSEALHGNKSQNARQRALENFRASKTPVLVATDIASRGIDIDNVSHVVNYDLTHEPETYVHRIGRTARAGASGAAVSFCDRDERQNLKLIERLIRRPIPVVTEHPVYVAKVGGHSIDSVHVERAERSTGESHDSQSNRAIKDREGRNREGRGREARGPESGRREGGGRDGHSRDGRDRVGQNRNHSGSSHGGRTSHEAVHPHAGKAMHAVRPSALAAQAPNSDHAPRKAHAANASHTTSASQSGHAHPASHASHATHGARPQRAAHPVHAARATHPVKAVKAHRKGGHAPQIGTGRPVELPGGGVKRSFSR